MLGGNLQAGRENREIGYILHVTIVSKDVALEIISENIKYSIKPRKQNEVQNQNID